MKKLLLSLIVASFLLIGCEQVIEIEGTPHQPVYIQIGSDTIIIGDSITAFHEWEIDSYGIPGATIGHIIDNLIDLDQYENIIILAGINNLASRHTPEFTKDEMDRLISVIGDKNIKIISLLPLNNYLKEYPTNNLVISANYLYSEYESFIDVYDLFAVGIGGNNPYTIADGIHLNEEGYDILETAIY